MSWLLSELAAHPEHQSIIREELKQSYHNDYDSLPFFNAAIKVSVPASFLTFIDLWFPLRRKLSALHPFAHTLARTAPHDDVLPLMGSKTLAIPKGQTLLCSTYLYNRYVCPVPLIVLRCEFITNHLEPPVYLGRRRRRMESSPLPRQKHPCIVGSVCQFVSARQYMGQIHKCHNFRT